MNTTETASRTLGRQLILDCWGCNELVSSADAVGKAVQESVTRAKATLLKLTVHEFHPLGISAFALIAESHIFLHTWPEHSYLALDAFTCGEQATPESCLEVIQDIFQPTRKHLRMLRRGIGVSEIEYQGMVAEQQTPNTTLATKVGRQLFLARSRFQNITVHDTTDWGRVLSLDNKFMVTERDERMYHEMLVHPAMCVHADPRRVLVIGGGDGGAVREVLQHPSVEQVAWVEIDSDVVETARTFLPKVSQAALTDPRVSLHITTGEEFVSCRRNEFDVVIVDSTDPIGPALPLFQTPFLRDCSAALREQGVYAAQAGTPFYYPEEFRSLFQTLGLAFHFARPYLGFVPSYPSGLWSYIVASNSKVEVSVEEIAARYRIRKLHCTYYSPQIHAASGFLPPFVGDILQNHRS